MSRETIDDALFNYLNACYGNRVLPKPQQREVNQAFLSGVHWMLNAAVGMPAGGTKIVQAELIEALKKIDAFPHGYTPEGDAPAIEPIELGAGVVESIKHIQASSSPDSYAQAFDLICQQLNVDPETTFNRTTPESNPHRLPTHVDSPAKPKG